LIGHSNPADPSERAMTNRRKIMTSLGFAAALLCAGASSAAADLQECFRDGYLCSVACDRSPGGKSAVAQCEARCNEEEKVCIGKVSASRSRPISSPAPVPTKVTLGGSTR
jgi:hypothetical protein